MTKDVLLSVKGLQFDAYEENSAIESVTFAEYYERNDSHYVLYEEVEEGFKEPVRNIMKFREKALELTKKGLINVHMIFEEGKKSMANYVTPFGDILLGLDTKKVSIKETEATIVVSVDYALELNYEHQADCSIQVTLKARE